MFPRGHRIRLAVSNALWPMIWPTPSPATSQLRLGPAGTRLVLPVVPAAEPGLPEPVFPGPGPEEPPGGVRHWGEILPVRWTVQRDESGTAAVSWRGTSGSQFPWGRVVDEEYLRYEVHDDRPAEASAHGEARTEVHLDGAAAGHVVHPGPGRRRDVAALPLPPRAALGRCRHPRAQLGAPLPPRPVVTPGPVKSGPRLKSDPARRPL